MSNFYAAGYQEAFSKLGATRWEQVFRESPEILEGALRNSSNAYRSDNLEHMKDFMRAKDTVKAKIQKLNLPESSQTDALKAYSLPGRDRPVDMWERKYLGATWIPSHENISRLHRVARSERDPDLMDKLFKRPKDLSTDYSRRLRDEITLKLGPTPNLPPDLKPESNLKRNLLIGGGTIAGLGGATGIALPLALRDKEKTAEAYSDAPSDARISRPLSALGGALAGAGLGVVPAYMGSFNPKSIASVSALGALLGGIGGALFPHKSTDSQAGDIFTGEGLPTAGNLLGGIGGAALGHKLFKGHLLVRAGLGFPGAVLGGLAGSVLARKLLASRASELVPQMKEASAMSTDLMRVLLDDLLKEAELKEEKTKSLHAPKYDRRMKFNTALERSGHQASTEAPLKEKTAGDPAFNFDGVTGREGVVTVEDELLRTPPLPIEEPLEYDVSNKPVMQKESEDMVPGEEGLSEKDLYSFTQRHPMLVPLLMGLGGAAVGAVPGAFLGGRLAARSAAKAYKANAPLFSIPAKDLARSRLKGRVIGGLTGGLLAGSGGALGGGAINKPQPWEE